MPARDGRLTESEHQRFLDWFEKKWKNKQCTLCGTGTWILGNHILIDEYATADVGITPDREYVPYFALFCQNCGHAVRVNALLAGVLDQHEPIGPGTSITPTQTSVVAPQVGGHANAS